MASRGALVLLLGLCVRVSHAQDAHFTQFYASPTYLSPAFAGTSAQTRFALAYRDQWPSIPGTFTTAFASFDHYLRELNSGIGVNVMHDRAGSGALRYTAVNVQYAYEIQLKRKVFLRPALRFGYVNHSVDWGVWCSVTNWRGVAMWVRTRAWRDVRRTGPISAVACSTSPRRPGSECHGTT